MSDWTWMEAAEDLTSVALTVRAQAVDPTDQGRLLWDQFMPRRNVDQTKLGSLTSQDIRIVSDRREWNTRGRYIPLYTPPTKELEWIPIEGYFKMEEKEINDILNEVRGNEALFRQVVGDRIPSRTEMLAMANWRRLEMEVFSAWANGTITYMNPQTGVTTTLDYGFDANRYTTAGTAWDVAANAYNEFLAWCQTAYETIGSFQGAMMRLATRNEIVADAPNPMPGATAALTPTVSQVEQRIQDELGLPFRFYINENSFDVFNDGGTAKTRTKVWPAQMVAAVPAGATIGSTAFAPVRRAYDLSAQVPGAGIDIRGITVYHEAANGGRELTVEGQFNPMPDPDEQQLYVIDAGV